ncbi:MAG: SAM-dependent methyltransferase [Nitriliruptorales bacterium]
MGEGRPERVSSASRCARLLCPKGCPSEPEEAVVRRLVISPHLDDAVLSCWAALSSGDTLAVTVATVFAGVPSADTPASDWDRAGGFADAAAAVTARLAEDEAALALAAAQFVHLDFLGEAYGSGPETRREIIDQLATLAQGFDEVWLPAALGGHGDHVLARDLALAATAGLRRTLYADLPYALGVETAQGSAVPWPPIDVLDWPGNWFGLPAAVSPPVLPTVVALDPATLAAKRRALACYGSQLAPLRAAFGQWIDDPHMLAFEIQWDLPAVAGDPVPCRAIAPMVRQGETERQEQEVEASFLSVLTRTRGQRPAQLDQTLDSLVQQTCDDFELLLLCHDTGPSEVASIARQLASRPALGQRARVVEVSGGNRSHPLNVGAELATGQYIAVLDDDDIALPEWVEEFRRVAEHCPGSIVRACVRVQDMDGDGTAEFPELFDILSHLVVNASPVCGLAYPRACFDELGLSFDESLNVLEDWDFLLRAAQLCGVATSPQVTSVYQRWGLGDDSHQHPAHEWAATAAAILDKLDRAPILLPPGSAGSLRRHQLELRRLQLEGHELQETVAALRGDLQRVTAVARQQAETLQEQQEQLAAAQLSLVDVVEQFRTSTSWRITAPLRAVSDLLARGGRRRPDSIKAGDNAERTNNSDAAASTDAGGNTNARDEVGDTATATVPPSYFEDLYARQSDPWGFAHRWYERRKYDQTLAALPRQHYRRGFEPGCSIGVLSEDLAARCDRLLCADVAEAALHQARQRLRGQPHVDFERMTIPADWPEGEFDLIVLSEVLCYLDDSDLSRTLDQAVTSLSADGTLVVVHHRARGALPQHGDGVHAVVRARPELHQIVSHEEPDFLLDVFTLEPHGEWPSSMAEDTTPLERLSISLSAPHVVATASDLLRRAADRGLQSDWTEFGSEKDNDLARLVVAVQETFPPGGSIETGVFMGGTSALFLLSGKPECFHISIDPYGLPSQSYSSETYANWQNARVTMSKLYQIAEEIGITYCHYFTDSETFCGYDLLKHSRRFNIIHLDGDHSYGTVRRELEYFLAKTDGPSVFIMDDHDEHFLGVEQALQEFRSELSLIFHKQYELPNYGTAGFSAWYRP